MDRDPWSMAAGLARVQVAGAHTAISAMTRYSELTLKFGERFARSLLETARDSGRPQGADWESAAATAMTQYRAYLRGLAALPTMAGMHYFDQIDRLRAEAAFSDAARVRESRSAGPTQPDDRTGLKQARPPAAAAPDHGAVESRKRKSR